MNITELAEIIIPQLKQPIWENWYIRERIGAGAFSAVYRVEAKRAARTDVSALKIQPIVPSQRFAAEEAQAREALMRRRAAVENESALMLRLRDCPHIVRYEDEDLREFQLDGKFAGYVFLIRMELMQNAADLFADGTLERNPQTVRRLGIEIGEALRYAHAAGIIHRDVKPDNFFMSADGTFKLGDFNIAKQADMTRSFAGTPGYMSPEVYTAKNSSGEYYTEQTDIYSLGICLYQMMNRGLFPFEDTQNPEEAFVMRITGTPLPKPLDAQGAFGDVILRACAYSVNERYRSAEELIAALRTLPESEYDPAVPYDPDATVYAAPQSDPDATVYAAPQPAPDATVYAAPQSAAAAQQRAGNAAAPVQRSSGQRGFVLKMLGLIAAGVLAAGIGVYAVMHRGTEQGRDSGTVILSEAEENTVTDMAVTDAVQDTAAVSDAGSGPEKAEDSVTETVLQTLTTAETVSGETTDTVRNDPQAAEAPPGNQRPGEPDRTPAIPVSTDAPAQPAEPENQTTTSIFRFSVSNGTAVIEGTNAPLQELIIPAEIDSVPVRSIADRAFENSDLTAVSFPNGLTEIGDGAFSGCSGIQSVILPDSVTKVGKHAFQNCDLSELKLSKGMTEIAPYTFSGCGLLESVLIPDGVTLIEDHAFDNCPWLIEVLIPYSVKEIRAYAFTVPYCKVYYGGNSIDWSKLQRGSNVFPGVTEDDVYYNQFAYWE
ncbi:MAG: leucine-rich repeat protein [Oscillospiraceae bacterium]|nr:leucine-rich repeat protein [Oscillospiraceae bacterium]MBR3446903.1 leucine-rich repeat protein [Oscillospiraceae bacterium]